MYFPSFYIIPKLKYFRSSFNDDCKLKENQKEYFKLITERLVKEGIISEKQAIQVRIENDILKVERVSKRVF